MPIPGADSAYISPEKLTDYLLNMQHPVGKSKANWFRGLGYDLADPTILEHDLLEVVRTSEDYVAKSSPFGAKYIVNGTITAPNGNKVNVTIVWITASSNDRPRLVTAYPGAKP